MSPISTSELSAEKATLLTLPPPVVSCHRTAPLAASICLMVPVESPTTTLDESDETATLLTPPSVSCCHDAWPVDMSNAVTVFALSP